MQEVKRHIEKLPKLDLGDDLFSLIGLQKGDYAKPQLAEAYIEYEKNHGFELASYAAWKVLRDNIYRKLYDETHSFSDLIDAGFFLDTVPPEDEHLLAFDERLFTTPIHKLAGNIHSSPSDDPPIVLLTTGGFSPIHYGHLNMMETAKKALEARGRTVVGGYFSPSHDHYVGTKYGGEAKLNAEHRIYLCQQAVDDSHWLSADPWEGLYQKTDINFTDVIERLKAYVNHFTPSGQEIQVYYVFGADNAGFTRVMKFADGAVCVSRSSAFNVRPSVFELDDIKDNSRLLFIRSDDESSDFSSSAARRWRTQLMPKSVAVPYFRWKKDLLSEDDITLMPTKEYIIRADATWALEKRLDRELTREETAALEVFCRGLTNTIQKSFSAPKKPDVEQPIKVTIYDSEEQNQYAQELYRTTPHVLNLDVRTNEQGGINASRLFNLADGQLRAVDLIARPTFPALNEQIAQIMPGDYLLVDDDIATGTTLNLLMGMLPDTVRVTSIRTLFNYSRRMLSQKSENAISYEVLDVVDQRDFILGASSGGLVVTLPSGELARAMYVYPFISLYSRATLPLSAQLASSIEVWRLNAELYESVWSDKVLADIDPLTAKLFISVGFTDQSRVVDICRYYFEALSAFSVPE